MTISKEYSFLLIAAEQIYGFSKNINFSFFPPIYLSEFHLHQLHIKGTQIVQVHFFHIHSNDMINIFKNCEYFQVWTTCELSRNDKKD